MYIAITFMGLDALESMVRNNPSFPSQGRIVRIMISENRAEITAIIRI